VSTFCQFFVDKVNRSRDIIAVKLQSTVRRLFTARPYLGLTLSSFRPVTTEEVRRLLSAMPSKSSPLDVLPCSLLKSCSDVFAPVIAKLANLSMQTVKFPASYKQAQVMPLLKKAGLLPWRRYLWPASICRWPMTWRLWPSPDIPETRHGGSTIVQLSFSGHIAIYAIYCLQNSRWHWLAISYWPDWTTATQCCMVQVLQPAAFRFCSECKTMQPGSFSKLQDDLMPSHYCVNCIDCPFNTESSTRWLCWPSRAVAAPQHRHTSVITSTLASVNGHFACLPSHYWTSRWPWQTLRDELFVVLRQLSGTRCLRQ